MSTSKFIPLRMPRFPFMPIAGERYADVVSQWQLAQSFQDPEQPLYLGVDVPSLLAVEQNAPAELEALAAAVQAGVVVPVLGVAAYPDDTLTTEALVQSQLFLHKRLSVTAKLAFLMPDAAVNPALPQLLRLAGVHRALICLPEEAVSDGLPGAFLWASPDGSKVLTAVMQRKRLAFLPDDAINALEGDPAFYDVPVLSGALPVVPEDPRGSGYFSEMTTTASALFMSRRQSAAAYYLCGQPDRSAPFADAVRALCFLQVPTADSVPTDDAALSAACAYAAAVADRERAESVSYAAAVPDRPVFKDVFTLTGKGVLLKAFKLCEDGSGDLVLRLAQSVDRECRASVLFDPADTAFWLDMQPYEIKTLRIGKDGRALEVNFLENIVPQRTESFPE
ncbi:MAG: hypothetical protein IJK02_08510 [Clostridia bacterium]|nr:hypothetical protein [Clostridia bacterium]